MRLLAALAILLAAAPARAETVRVLVHNLWGRDEADCAERYKALAANILAASPPYDVVALQEDWKVPGNIKACDPENLTKALEAGGTYAGKGRSIRHLPRTQDALQIAGGVSVFTRHEIVDAYENRFVNSTDFPLSGYALARVKLASGAEIDVWDAHLEAGSDGCDDDCRWEGATDFGSEVELFSGLPEKGKTGNPVLIVGDLNTGGPMTKKEKPPYSGNGGYANVMDALGNPRDLWLELGSGDGYTYDCKANNTVEKCDYRERIDYVLLPESKRILSPKSENVLVPLKVEVVRWKTAKGQNVSDHFGLDATFEIRKRPAAAPDEPKPAARKSNAKLKAALDDLGAANPGAVVK